MRCLPQAGGLRAQTAIGRLLLYARTARHLQPRQLVYRPLRILQRRLDIKPRVARTALVADSARAPLVSAALAALEDRMSPRYRDSAQSILAGELVLLGQPARLDTVDWLRWGHSRLWTYHLHYFEYAVDLALARAETGDERYAAALADLLESWMGATESEEGPGWDPYPISVRVVNWLRALALLSPDALPDRMRARIHASVGRQLDVLAARLEWDVMANHLLKNLVALFVGGLFFSGPRAARWLNTARAHLWRQFADQVLPDGVHFERSPMYHKDALSNMLVVFAVADAVGEPCPGDARERLTGMVSALGALSRADGRLHLFNDCVERAGPSMESIESAAHRITGRPSPRLTGGWELADAGFFGYRDPAGDFSLAIDAGSPGPVYQPGHAHCGLLGFELDLGPEPLVVDSGVKGYDGDDLRGFVRSTRAHNTLVIDGLEQSELWGTFRLARRAQVVRAAAKVAESGYSFEGAYRPYYSRAVLHSRVISASPGSLVVEDRVDGAPGKPLASFVHLHPDWEAVLRDDHVVVTKGSRRVTVMPIGADDMTLERGATSPAQGWYCPAFGLAVPNAVLVLRRHRNDGRGFGYRVDWRA